MPKIFGLGTSLLEKEAERKKHEEGNTVVFANWLESGLLNDSDLDIWNFESTEYLALKERDDALEKLNTLKGSLSTLKRKNKEITEGTGESSREAENLHKEMTSFRTAQERLHV